MTRAFILATLLLFLSACAAPPQHEAQQVDVPVESTPTEESPMIPVPEQAPEAATDCWTNGDDWHRRYAEWICNFPAKDAGKPCTKSRQCQGACLAARPGSGACSESTLLSGCINLFEEGNVIPVCI